MNIEDTKDAIYAASLVNDSVLLSGLHGIGKSSIVHQLAKENDWHLEVLFLSTQDVGDLIGNPHTLEKDGKYITTWTVPAWLQRMYDANKAGKKCALFCDELNRAELDVRQAALPLVNDKRLHEHPLPELNGIPTFVVAAINPPDNPFYQVHDMDMALMDRFLSIEIDVDAKSTIKYWKSIGLNSIIIDFISEFPDRIHDGITSPRSWTKLAEYIDVVDNIPHHILFNIIKGKVGAEIGSQFYSFLQNYTKVVSIKDIEILVDEMKDATDINDVASVIEELTVDVEPMRKLELTQQLADKYMQRNDSNILPFLAYLYSLPVELLIAFVKDYGRTHSKEYKRLADIDDVLNNKELFERVVRYTNE